MNVSAFLHWKGEPVLWIPQRFMMYPCLLYTSAKTDPRDALLIAEVIRFGHFSESTLHPDNIYELRELCRGRHAIVSMQADVKRKVVALLDQVFPEYETAFRLPQ